MNPLVSEGERCPLVTRVTPLVPLLPAREWHGSNCVRTPTQLARTRDGMAGEPVATLGSTDESS